MVFVLAGKGFRRFGGLRDGEILVMGGKGESYLILPMFLPFSLEMAAFMEFDIENWTKAYLWACLSLRDEGMMMFCMGSYLQKIPSRTFLLME